MNFKRKVIKLNSSIALSLALLSCVEVATNSLHTVQASSYQKAKLTHNAFIYDSKGRRKIGFTLKNGKLIKVYNRKKIKGQSFVRIGKNKYIKKVNIRKIKKCLFTINLENYVSAHVIPQKDSAFGNDFIGNQKIYKTQKDSDGNQWLAVNKDNWLLKTDVENSNKKDKDVADQENRPILSNSPKKTIAEITNNKYVKAIEDSFLNQLNTLRESKSIRPFSYDETLHSYAKLRAKETLRNYSHVRPNGEKTKFGEVLAGGTASAYGSPEITAKEILDCFIYYDAASNWQHRDLLLNPNYTKMGVGIAWDKNTDYADAAVGFNLIANFY